MAIVKNIPLTEDFMKKTTNATIYAYLQTISYSAEIEGERKTFVYKSQATPAKILKFLEDQGIQGAPGITTIKKIIPAFVSMKLMCAGKIEDNFGKIVDCYFLSDDLEKFQQVPLETLRFLINATNSNVIKTYAYLLDKYEWKTRENSGPYKFTKAELITAIGYSTATKGKNKGSVYQMMDDILEILEDCGLVYYDKIGRLTTNGTPTTGLMLTKVNKYKVKKGDK